MFHGVAFVADIQQTGSRGRDKLFSTNWFMGMGQHRAGKGSFMIRTMFSLEPATVTDRRYPELFQTGETAYGRPIIDGQHPHNLFMELAVQYARPIGDKTLLDVYAAPVGDPALGPVAYPHRVSAFEMPQAPLGHHLQDSTHISYDVVTVGVQHGIVRMEASGFHGAEPGENRWTIGRGAMDSWSARLWITPSSDWRGQVSLGRLRRPEALEPGDIVRSTASLTYNRPFVTGNWATSIIWGRNHKTVRGRNLNSFLAESTLQLRRKNSIMGRLELVDKEELLQDRPDLVFRVAAFSAGYVRDMRWIPGLDTGFGANFTLYSLPTAIKPFYSDRPAALLFFLRVRLRESG